MKRLLSQLASVRSPFSPGGLLARAVALSAVFIALHAAGLRPYTSFLSGTFVLPEHTELSAFLGLAYILSYLAFSVLVPILVIAAGLLFFMSRTRNAFPPTPPRSGIQT